MWAATSRFTTRRVRACSCRRRTSREPTVYTTAVARTTHLTSDERGGGITINLLEPNTIFADYYKIFDMRFSKTMNIGRQNRITALAEFDNLLQHAERRWR